MQNEDGRIWVNILAMVGACSIVAWLATTGILNYIIFAFLIALFSAWLFFSLRKLFRGSGSG